MAVPRCAFSLVSERENQLAYLSPWLRQSFVHPGGHAVLVNFELTHRYPEGIVGVGYE